MRDQNDLHNIRLHIVTSLRCMGRSCSDRCKHKGIEKLLQELFEEAVPEWIDRSEGVSEPVQVYLSMPHLILGTYPAQLTLVDLLPV